MGFHG
jgi:hypothetical protein